MWLGQYQRRPNQEGEGQVGRVTIGGEQTAVLLDSERRGWRCTLREDTDGRLG